MLRWLSMVASLVALSGCDVELLHDLDEGEANAVLVALDRVGIAGTKGRVTSGNKASYTVSVGRADASRAWGVLRRLNLPRPRQRGIAEVFGKSGLVPTATQERAMMRHAVAAELTRTLQSLEGVRAARVHVVLPRRDPLAPADAARPRPRASVLLKVGKASPLSEAQIKKLVAGGVDGLAVDAVSVIISRSRGRRATESVPLAATTSVGPFEVATGSRVSLLATLIVLVVICFGLAAVVLLLGRRNRALRRARAAASTMRPAELDSSMSLLARSIGSRAGSIADRSRPAGP